MQMFYNIYIEVIIGLVAIFMKTFLNKLFFGSAYLSIGVLIVIPLASCSLVTSPTPDVTPPVVTPPVVTPPSTNPLYDYQRFYDVKNAQFLDGPYAGLINTSKIIANTPYAESNVHMVPFSLSKLPSFFMSADILSLISLKDNSLVPQSINIADYNDSLRTSGIQNWFENENSSIPHADKFGRAKYKVVPVDSNYKIMTGITTSSNIDYSYIDVEINFSTPNESIANHTFKHTFLFLEGVNEVRHGTRPSQAYLPLFLTDEQKVVLGNDRNKPQLIVETLTTDNTYTTFDPNILKHFVEVKHMKPSKNIENSNSSTFIDGAKILFDLPTNLSYTPILQNETDTPVLMFRSSLIFNATDTNNGFLDDQKSVKWHNFGKLGAKDTLHRGRSTTGGIGNWNNELTWSWTSFFVNL